ncbi:hypothetical protein L209DRAFT_263510 [Thermothelomyces heterothallicus CBS 203.75]
MKLVQYFTSILQFELPRSCRDNNGPALPEHGGRFYACHVEKKLAVFWLIAALKAVLGTTDLRRARELKGAEIPEAWRSASIFLDHSPCVNVSKCWRPDWAVAVYQANIKPPLGSVGHFWTKSSERPGSRFTWRHGRSLCKATAKVQRGATSACAIGADEGSGARRAQRAPQPAPRNLVLRWKQRAGFPTKRMHQGSDQKQTPASMCVLEMALRGMVVTRACRNLPRREDRRPDRRPRGLQT